MSEENVTSTISSNDKYYLGVIAVLVLILFYLLFLRDGSAVAQTQQQTKQVPQKQAASQTNTGGGAQAAADAKAIKEGWGAVPMDQKMVAWLKAHNIKTIAFVDDKLQLLIANPSGKEVPVCARPVGATGVAGKCTESSEPVRYSIELSLERRGDASTYCWKRGGNWVCM